MRLNLIRTGCKPFGLHQAISKCLIKLLLKLIVKTIYLNTPNNISVNKQSKPISRFPTISYHFSAHVSPPILAGPTFATALPHRASVCRCTISPDLRMPPHYLAGPPFAAALPGRTSICRHTTSPDLGDLFLFSKFFGFCYILIDLAVAIF